MSMSWLKERQWPYAEDQSDPSGSADLLKHLFCPVLVAFLFSNLHDSICPGHNSVGNQWHKVTRLFREQRLQLVPKNGPFWVGGNVMTNVFFDFHKSLLDFAVFGVPEITDPDFDFDRTTTISLYETKNFQCLTEPYLRF
jgi:hypothetical protein